MSTKAAADDALKNSWTGFDVSIPATDVPGVHPVIRGKGLYEFQSNLPHLPIPSLEATLERYKNSLRPLLAHDPAALQRALTAVEEFRTNDGPRLHQLLVEFDQTTGKEHQWPNTHWLEK
jgi:hypothetical protein